ncbi:MAG: hypothetical protein K2X81_10615 [Candidatus Obscuribacterales bacterium]|nr:hypothetical protein [Candidatus Obscuribacterales bacterium]
MAQPLPEEQITLDQVLKLVDKLTPEEQVVLRKKMSDKTWGQEWRALCKEIDEQNKDKPALSEDEIVAEVKTIRNEIKAERAESGN